MKLAKLALAVAIIGGAQSAQAATYFSMDSNGAGEQGAANYTSYYKQMEFNYDSTTKFTDKDGSGTLSAGDTFVGTGGLMNSMAGSGNPGSNNYANNQVLGFLPTLVPTGANTDHYGDNWGLSFGWNNLAGHVINGVGGTVYDSGTINVWYYSQADINAAGFGTQAGATTIGMGTLVLTLDVLGGGNNFIGQSLDLFGKVTYAKAGFMNMQGFGDLNSLISLHMATTWNNDQNTSPFYVNGVKGETPAALATIFANGSTGIVAGQHNGSIEFNVPEPMSLSLLGIGLLGMGAFRRKSC